MDYPNRRRLKIDGLADVEPLEADEALRSRLRPQDLESGAVERLFRIQVEAFDWNCPQFITPRFTEVEMEERERTLRDRIEILERELKRFTQV